ncbi:MAG: hypothetical protein BGO90_03900 [Legionella sp. 40-6]|nr:MAG: hypothetical protein BGO90_03900 [Legionella sp. 40-6]
MIRCSRFSTTTYSRFLRGFKAFLTEHPTASVYPGLNQQLAALDAYFHPPVGAASSAPMHQDHRISSPDIKRRLTYP